MNGKKSPIWPVGDTIDLSAIAGLSFVGVGNNFTGQANQVRFVGNPGRRCTRPPWKSTPTVTKTPIMFWP
jgi:hypothetical protein